MSDTQYNYLVLLITITFFLVSLVALLLASIGNAVARILKELKGNITVKSEPKK